MRQPLGAPLLLIGLCVASLLGCGSTKLLNPATFTPPDKEAHRIAPKLPEGSAVVVLTMRPSPKSFRHLGTLKSRSLDEGTCNLECWHTYARRSGATHIMIELDKPSYVDVVRTRGINWGRLSEASGQILEHQRSGYGVRKVDTSGIHPQGTRTSVRGFVTTVELFREARTPAELGRLRCRHLPVCKKEGRCRFEHGRCQPEEADCQGLPACARFGRCSLKGGVCTLRDDDDCRRTTACKERGHCAFAGGACRISTDADCQRSHACLIYGRCTAQGGECRATSQADCNRIRLMAGLYTPLGCTTKSGMYTKCKPRRPRIAATTGHIFSPGQQGAGGQCIEQRIASCRHVDAEGTVLTRGCSQSGRCSGKNLYACRAATHADCMQSERCRKKGECRRASYGGCVIGRP